MQPADPIGRSGPFALIVRTRGLLDYLLSVSRSRALLTSLFLVLGSFSEGLSLVLLFPILQFVGRQGTGTILELPIPSLMPAIGGSVHIDLSVVLSAFVVIVCVSALFNRFKSVYMAELLLETINKLRLDLFRSIARARWSTIVRMRMADLDHLLTGDIDRVQSAVAALFLLTQNLVMLSVYVLLSALLSLKMTVFATISGALVFLALRSIRNKAALLGDSLTVERQTQYRTISGFLAGLKMTKSFNGEERYLQQLAATLGALRKQLIAYVRLTSLATGFSQCLLVALGCLFIYLSYAVYAVPFTKIIVMLVIFTRISPRFRDVQDQYQIVLVNLAAFEAMMRKKTECDADREDDIQSEDVFKPSLESEIEFDNVGFSYGSSEILKRISFKVPARQITALIGPSGSGKTTLADLAMGLQMPSSGVLRIDGIPLTEKTHKSWRRHVAYVPQDTFILSASILDNLTIGMPSADLTSIHQALDAAQASEFVKNLPSGLETIVGDGGLQLSGGERQRIALARALLRRPSLLILDEATSALDRANSDRIVETLNALKEDCAILVITHNPAIARCAGQIVELLEGEVINTQPKP